MKQGNNDILGSLLRMTIGEKVCFSMDMEEAVTSEVEHLQNIVSRLYSLFADETKNSVWVTRKA